MFTAHTHIVLGGKQKGTLGRMSMTGTPHFSFFGAGNQPMWKGYTVHKQHTRPFTTSTTSSQELHLPGQRFACNDGFRFVAWRSEQGRHINQPTQLAATTFE